jgi:putative membrane protein
VSAPPARERDVRIGRPLRENRFLQVVVGLYAVAFGWSAIAPKYPRDWALENLLVIPFLVTLAVTHRRFVFSNFSSLLIALFLALHAYGAHYTYSETPLGAALAEAFGWARNHYDRFVHFGFGVLLAYPLHELARRVLHLRGAWAYCIPFFSAMAMSAGYEIVESWAARIVSPELGTAFLGTQGDEWDAQKDMALAMSGALIALSLAGAYQRATGREAWGLWAPEARSEGA